MTWLIRTGALRTVFERGQRDPAIRKSDAPRPPNPDDMADAFDAALASIGGTRMTNDERRARLAKYDAADAERKRRATDDAARDAALIKKPYCDRG